ncbi:MAG: Dabb family protein [Rhizobiaceae bacterium]|nr:Dabb family protein [Rhizobiaceae bacterium]
MIRHTVVFRLKHEPHSAAEREFLDAAKVLADIPGVQKFEQLRQVSPKNDYSFGFSMEFGDQAAYQGYNDHPDHVAFVRDRWVPEVDAFLEIDYTPLGRQPVEKPRQGMPPKAS